MDAGDSPQAVALVLRKPDICRSHLQCCNNPRVGVINPHRALRLDFSAPGSLFSSRFNEAIISSMASYGIPGDDPVFSSRFNEAIISSAVSNGPAVWPFL